MIGSKDLQNLLFQYELVTQRLQDHQERHAAVFQKHAELVEMLETLKATLRRSVYTEGGPPDEVPAGKKTHVFATGKIFAVRVTYRRMSDWYESKALPASVLAKPGVVLEVSAAQLAKLEKKDNRIRDAKRIGEWMTPVLQLPRLRRLDSTDVADEET